MDRASAIRIIHSGRCPYLGDGRTNQPWPNRFLHRSTLLAKHLGLIEKGRMIEIEAIYCSLFAFALILCLLLWEQKRSPCLTFVVPWIFLGLGLLAKGPSHVLFFYLIVGAVLWRNRRLRNLTHPAHFIGVAVMLGIFVTWLIPYFQALPSRSPLQAWSREAAVAFHGEEGRSEDWLLNFPRGFAYLLPWVLLLPFIRLSKITDPITAQRSLWISMEEHYSVCYCSSDSRNTPKIYFALGSTILLDRRKCCR